MTAGPLWLRMHVGAEYLSVYPFIHLYVDLANLSTPLIHLPACPYMPPNINHKGNIHRGVAYSACPASKVSKLQTPLVPKVDGGER